MPFGIDDALLVAGIGSMVGKLFQGKGAQKRATNRANVEEQSYNDAVQYWLQQQAQTEQNRQNRISLISSFAKSNGLEGFMSPEMESILRRAAPVPTPPPFRRGSDNAGSTWDLIGSLIGEGAGLAGNAMASRSARLAPGVRSRATMPTFSSSDFMGPWSRFGIGGGVPLGSSVPWYNSSSFWQGQK